MVTKDIFSLSLASPENLLILGQSQHSSSAVIQSRDQPLPIRFKEPELTMTGKNPAYLANQPYPHPSIASWQEVPGSRFEEVLARQYHLPSDDGNSRYLHTGIPPSSDTSSIAGTIASSIQMGSTSTGNVPSLNRSQSTMSSNSLDTRNTSHPPIPTTIAVLQCAFAFLGCTETFHDKQQWSTHTLYHLHGHPPPTKSQCPFCAAQWRDPGAWNTRMNHIADHHRGEHLDASCRPDCDLYRYLLDIRVIDGVMYQELVRHRWWNSSGDHYVEMNNPGRDRRRGAPQASTTRRVRS